MTATLAYAPTPPILTLLTRQRDLYRQLKALSGQQATLIEDGHADQLLTLLAQRQGIVDALLELNRELLPVRQSPEEIPVAHRAEVRRLIGEVDELLQEIIAQDDRDRQSLQSAKHAVNTQIKQVRQGGTAINAYRATPPSSSAARFTDRLG